MNTSTNYGPLVKFISFLIYWKIELLFCKGKWDRALYIISVQNNTDIKKKKRKETNSKYLEIKEMVYTLVLVNNFL